MIDGDFMSPGSRKVPESVFLYTFIFLQRRLGEFTSSSLMIKKETRLLRFTAEIFVANVTDGKE